MFRWFVFAFMALLSSVLFAEEKIYQKGEYRFSVKPAPAFVVPNTLVERWPADAP